MRKIFLIYFVLNIFAIKRVGHLEAWLHTNVPVGPKCNPLWQTTTVCTTFCPLSPRVVFIENFTII